MYAYVCKRKRRELDFFGREGGYRAGLTSHHEVGTRQVSEPGGTDFAPVRTVRAIPV